MKIMDMATSPVEENNSGDESVPASTARDADEEWDVQKWALEVGKYAYRQLRLEEKKYHGRVIKCPMCLQKQMYLLSHLKNKHKWRHQDAVTFTKHQWFPFYYGSCFEDSNTSATDIILKCPVDDLCPYIGTNLGRHLRMYVFVYE